MEKFKIIWTDKASAQLKSIYDYYKDERQTPQGAKTVKNEILRVARRILHPGQYQKDEIQPEYRRFIVRHYKVLYKEENGNILILRIFNTARNPQRQLDEND
jgi:plasmid stabilization system protein ParE